ncbi:MAG: malonyl-CoA synthase [Pseudomonadota bacterium]
MSENLFTVIHNSIKKPEAVFIRRPDGTAITYDALCQATAQFANLLLQRGVKPGDRVAAQVEKSVEALFLYLATVRVGAAFLPLNSSYTGTELAYFLKDAEPRVFVTDPGAADAADQLCKEAGVAHLFTLAQDGTGSLMEATEGAPINFEDVPRKGDDLAAILYTSGTTGRSKGAMITHENLASNACALVESWRFSESDILLHALPIFHTHGLFVATNTALLAGASMIFLPAFDSDEVIRLLPQATTMMGVPTFYSRLLTQPEFDQALVQHMRLFVSGSAPLSAETHKAFQARTGHAILERYGMTETNMNTSNPYDGDRRAGTVGFPLPGVEIRLTDGETASVVPQGEIGMIEIRGPNVFKGYWRLPEKTAAELREDGFFISGDLGVIDKRGYLSIVGREKDLIISGGFNVYPAEVEAALEAIDGVSECAVIGAPHPDFGEGVTGVVVRDEGADLTESAIRAALKTELAAYKVPKRVFFVKSLPRNKMGKIEKKSLRETYKDAYGAT